MSSPVSNPSLTSHVATLEPAYVRRTAAQLQLGKSTQT